MKFKQSPRVIVRRTPEKGWGVFARRPIAMHSVVEEVPVLLVPRGDVWNPDGTSVLADYLFAWDDEHLALALGYGSLYNHSYTPNAKYVDDDPAAKRYVAIRNIDQGEEITINYNAEPHDRTDVGFEVVE